MICELRQTLWLDTPKGQMRAKFLIDAGDDADMQWVCVNEQGEFWTWVNADVRLAKNITLHVRLEEGKPQ